MTLAPDGENSLPLLISKLETDQPTVNGKFIQPRPSKACPRKAACLFRKCAGSVKFVHIDAFVLFDRSDQECTKFQLGYGSRSEIAVQKLIEGHFYRMWIVTVAFQQQLFADERIDFRFA
jgi:hypothetical protein